MDTLLVKVVVTPALIMFASLVGRRFGQSVAGWLIAFPWTSAPVSFFLTLEHGTAFATAAARGSIAMVAAECAFALAYAHIARSWPVTLALASAAYAAGALVMSAVTLDAAPLAFVMAAVLFVTARLLPRPAAWVARQRAIPPWDLTLRAVLGTALVVSITFAAPALGPYGSAVAASFPLFASILAVFAHREAGQAAAVDVMRGLVTGLIGFTVFFAVVAVALAPLGLLAFALATAGLALTQTLSLRMLPAQQAG